MRRSERSLSLIWMRTLVQTSESKLVEVEVVVVVVVVAAVVVLLLLLVVVVFLALRLSATPFAGFGGPGLTPRATGCLSVALGMPSPAGAIYKPGGPQGSSFSFACFWRQKLQRLS